MKRSKASWTTAVAASALLALPVGSWAQQMTPSTSTPPQTTGAPAPPTGRTPGADMQKGSANEHLRQAQSALADIPAASLAGTAKTRVAELKKHLNTLEQSASKPASGSTTARNANWSTEVAAVDRILTELLGSTATTGAATPAPAGTTGSTATAPKTTTSGKPAASMTLDEPSRAKLQEVRTHVTAFAAAMSGTSSSTPSTSARPTPSTDDPSTSASASAAPASATASPATPSATATPSPTGTSGTTAAPAAATPDPQSTATPSTPADPAAAASPQSSTQPPAATTPSPTPSQQVDAETVKRHLTSARDSLSQLTQLPAAAQLTGDARTQVSQLISNFNELITTNTDWRASYTKVQANLTALVGADEAPAAAAPAAGTAGAVGTSGQVAVDPAIKAKLIEMRTHLMEFEKAAGGGASTTASAAQPSEPAASASSATASPAASSTSSTTATASAPSSATASAATASPEPTATTGSTAQAPATAGTSGTGTPTPASSDQATKPATSARDADTPKAADGHRAAMTHIEAIESILNGGAPAGTSGTAAKPASAGTLDRAQIEQIRTHLSQLRRELSKSEK